MCQAVWEMLELFHLSFWILLLVDSIIIPGSAWVPLLLPRIRQHLTSSLFCCCCWCWVASVMSDSARPHRWQPTTLPRPWDSPGKNTGVGCHFLFQCVKVKLLSHVRLSDPMDCSLPGSSVHGIFQARVLEWGAIAFSLHSFTLLSFFFSRKGLRLTFCLKVRKQMPAQAHRRTGEAGADPAGSQGAGKDALRSSWGS